jgi:hypothetical protein
MRKEFNFMENLTVYIYPHAEGQFFTSYIDPLSRKRVRDYFKNKPEALNHKKFIEDKFKKKPSC